MPLRVHHRFRPVSGRSDVYAGVVEVRLRVPVRGHRGAVVAVRRLVLLSWCRLSHSSSAAIAAIGQIMIPRMIKEGYPAGHATALVACSSVLALMIPLSIPMSA